MSYDDLSKNIAKLRDNTLAQKEELQKHKSKLIESINQYMNNNYANLKRKFEMKIETNTAYTDDCVFAELAFELYTKNKIFIERIQVKEHYSFMHDEHSYMTSGLRVTLLD